MGDGVKNLFGDEIKSGYDAFVDKFKTENTTDDCYTPPAIYKTVADWVAQRFNLDPATFCRPFYPGGDYTAEDYTGKVVVDNPPFSILSKIVRFYTRKGVPFFLFAPTLTLFAAELPGVTYLPLGVTVTYENGATVNTSFVTNLIGDDIIVQTRPDLYQLVEKADKELQKALRKTVPKYEYPDYIVTSAMVARWCKYGVEYTLRRSDCMKIGALDQQKEVKKSIFGNGFLLSERAAAERAAAERAAAERAAAERWKLSERERQLVAKLSGVEVQEDLPPMFQGGDAYG